MSRVRSPQDLGAAVTFLVLGLAGAWFGRGYEVGTASRMGPGYMPMVLSGALVVFGIVVGFRAVKLTGPPIERGVWRTNVLVLAAIVAFVFLIESAGLAAATFAVTVLSGLASPEARWKETLALGVLLAIFCVLVFVYGLRQSMSAFGPF
jgi:hypothetical protein